MNTELVDKHLDAVLRASGSALKHYSMQKTLDDMRAAMRAAMADPVRAELVAALEKATNVLAGIAVGDLKTIYHNSPALAQARAALAKAKGE